MARFRSQRYESKPSCRRVSCTSETWDESMLCREMPDELTSQHASVIRSFRASSTFLRMEPCTRRASNMVAARSFAVEEKNGKAERSWPSRRRRESVWSCLFVLSLASSSSSGSPAQRRGRLWQREGLSSKYARKSGFNDSASLRHFRIRTESPDRENTAHATAETVLQRTSL